ncbi:unnamed protein product, partial [Scytosiphon promiscuus]
SSAGLDGFQIVPRFATYVYFNCKTTDVSLVSPMFLYMHPTTREFTIQALQRKRSW